MTSQINYTNDLTDPYGWRICNVLEAGEPENYVLAVGENVAEPEQFERSWVHCGEHGQVDDLYLCPSVVDHIVGVSKVEMVVSWKPLLGFQGLVHRMVLADHATANG